MTVILIFVGVQKCGALIGSALYRVLRTEDLSKILFLWLCCVPY